MVIKNIHGLLHFLNTLVLSKVECSWCWKQRRSWRLLRSFRNGRRHSLLAPWYCRRRVLASTSYCCQLFADFEDSFRRFWLQRFCFVEKWAQLAFLVGLVHYCYYHLLDIFELRHRWGIGFLQYGVRKATCLHLKRETRFNWRIWTDVSTVP